MMKAVILDDEKRGSELLHNKLMSFRELEVIKVFNDPKVALKEMENLAFDVLFLDIEMPAMNGFEFLEHLGSFQFEVIFVTAYNQYTLDALRLHAIDYLLKPVDEDDLKDAIGSLQVRLEEKKKNTIKLTTNRQRIALNTAEGVHLIEKTHVIRVEALNNYSVFILINGKKIMVAKTLKEFEQVLADDNFIRVNRSTILNIDYAVKYKKGDGGSLELEDGTEIEVSPLKKDEVLRAIM